MPLTVVTFFSTLASPCLVDTHTRRLSESGALVLSPEVYNKANVEERSSEKTVLFIGTGGTENAVADFLDTTNVAFPIILFSHLSNNSLPASMEIRSYLEQNGLDATIVHLPLQGLVDKLALWVKFEKILETIQNSTLGLIGSPSSWLIASLVNQALVTERWGLKFKEFETNILMEPNRDATSIFDEYSRSAHRTEVTDEELKKAASVASRLEEIVESEDLDAVTVQCFDFLNKTNISGCIALSHINNKPDRTGGCEGDVPSTFTMFLVQLLTGTSSFMANVTEVNAENNSVVFAHCTVPTTLVKEYDLLTHFETDKSVGIRGTFENQKVTIFKVSGDELLEYWAAAGSIKDNSRSEDGCRTQIRVDLESDVSYFLDSSLANHHVVIPGDHVELIEEFFSYVYLESISVSDR